jgi:hypothetical protein
MNHSVPPATPPPPEPQAGPSARGAAARGSAVPQLELAIHDAEQAVMRRDARVHDAFIRIDARLQRRLDEARRCGAWAGVAALLLGGGAWLSRRRAPAAAPAGRRPPPVAPPPAGPGPLALMLLRPLFAWWAHRWLHPSLAAVTAHLLPLLFAARHGDAARTRRR